MTAEQLEAEAFALWGARGATVNENENERGGSTGSGGQNDDLGGKQALLGGTGACVEAHRQQGGDVVMQQEGVHETGPVRSDQQQGGGKKGNTALSAREALRAKLIEVSGMGLLACV